jgi:hypothetical protein
MLVVIAIGFAHVVAITIAEKSVFARASEYTLYSGIGLLGIALGSLSIREGFNVVRPSRARDSQPLNFWVDTLVFLFAFPAAALWRAWTTYTNGS